MELVRASSWSCIALGSATLQPSAICSTGPRPLMMFTRVMVNGTPPSVRKREEKPPPRKYSWIAGHHSVAARQASASLCSISQWGFIVGLPCASRCWQEPSSAAEPELIR